MNNTKDHQRLVDDLLYAFGSRPDVRCWPRVVGVAFAVGTGNPIKYGIVGESDIDGIVKPCGRRLCIEAKTGKGKLTAEQIKFREMIINFGGIYIEARSVEQALREFGLALGERK